MFTLLALSFHLFQLQPATNTAEVISVLQVTTDNISLQATDTPQLQVTTTNQQGN